MNHGKHYVDSAKLIDRTKTVRARRRPWSCAARPLRPSSTRPLSCMSAWALTAAMLTSRSAALSCCPTAPAKTFALLLSAKGDAAKAAEAAGADEVGDDDLIAKIQGEATWTSTFWSPPRT